MIAADNIRLGNGISQPGFGIGGNAFAPITTWPPVYSLLLSLFLQASPAFEQAASYLNMPALAATLLIFAKIV